jgi:hypothetical protein
MPSSPWKTTRKSRKSAKVRAFDTNFGLVDTLLLELSSRVFLSLGTYGVVYRARKLNYPCRIVAMRKRIRLEAENESVASNAIREISLLKEFDITIREPLQYWSRISVINLNLKIPVYYDGYKSNIKTTLIGN